MAKSRGFPVVILGMHRSGTSAVAGILHNIGISMGTKFLDADKHNPKGYYEDDDFLWINKGIIEHSGGTWFDPPSVTDIIKGGKKFREIIEKTVKEKRKEAGANLWGWKDPRNCLTCWSYAQEIPDARFIVVVRSLSSIKRSLNTTHGHLANWDTVIDKYYHSVIQFLDVHDNNSLNVSFEELVYEKYARKTVLEILNFVNKPESLTDRALKVMQFR